VLEHREADFERVCRGWGVEPIRAIATMIVEQQPRIKDP